MKRNTKIVINSIGKKLSKNSNLIIIHGFTSAGLNIKVLIDSGAEANVLSEKIFKKMNQPKVNTDFSLSTAQGDALPVLGSINMNLSLGDEIFEIETLITPILHNNFDLILGLPFLTENKTQICTTPNQTPKFYINNKVIPLIKETKNQKINIFTIKQEALGCQEIVSTTRKLKLPARTTGCIRISIPPNQQLLNRLIFFEPFLQGDDKGLMKKHLIFEPGIIELRIKRGKYHTYIVYYNNSYNTLNLPKGQKIGFLSVVTEPDNPGKNSTNKLIGSSHNISNLNKDKIITEYIEGNKNKPSLYTKCKNLATKAYNNSKQLFTSSNILQVANANITKQHSINLVAPQERKNINKTEDEVRERWNYVKGLLENKAMPGTLEEAAIFRIMSKFTNLVKLPNEKLKHTNAIEHTILYNGPKSLFVYQYPVPVSLEQRLEREVDRMLEQDLIEDSTSSFNFPHLAILKNDKLRVCMDFRQLNLYSEKVRFPLPRIDDILAKLKDAKYFTVIDLKSAFNQILLSPESRKYCTFRTKKGCYQYKRLPFGLSAAPSTMQKLIWQVVRGLNNVFVFLDDILVTGKSLEQAEINVTQVLQRLQDYNLTIAPEKCCFFTKSCNYLGHRISSEGISPLPEKIQAIKEYPVPKTLKDLRAFLGLSSYYRKFIKKYAEKAAPLHNLTQGHKCMKGTKIVLKWQTEHDEAFNSLKRAILTDVILAFPDFSKPFRLTTDASNTSIGGVLSQLDEFGNDRPISFFSRKMLKTELNYDILNKESLALLYGLNINRTYIYGNEVHLISDNQPLVYLLKGKNTSQRVARWRAAMAEYNIISIEHKSGACNKIADALSRIQLEDKEDTIDNILKNIPSLNAITKTGAKIDSSISWSISELPLEQEKNYLYSEIKKYLRGKPAKLPRYLPAPLNQFQIEEDILYYKSYNRYGKCYLRVCLPESYTNKALVLAHESKLAGHNGLKSTLQNLGKFCYWPKIYASTRKFLDKCKTCLLNKQDKSKKAPILSYPDVRNPWFRLNLDLIGPLAVSRNGYRYILTVIDVFSKFGVASPLTDKSARTVAKAFVNDVICPFGICREIVSDRGSEFISEIFKESVKILGISQKFVTSYRPQASGQVERWNQSLCKILRALTYKDPFEWDESLKIACLAYNNSFHNSIEETPFFLMFCRDLNLPYNQFLNETPKIYDISNYKTQLLQKTHNMFKLVSEVSEKKRFHRNESMNQNRQLKDVSIGDRIYIKKINPIKLESRYYGPCRVLGTRGSIVWARDLSRPQKLLQVHMDRIKLEKHVTVEECENIGDIYPNERSIEPEKLEEISKGNTSFENVLENVSDMNAENMEPLPGNGQKTEEVNVNLRYPLRNRLNRDK